MTKMDDTGIQDQIKQSLIAVKNQKDIGNSKDIQLAALKIKSERDDKKIKSLIKALRESEKNKEKSYVATVALGTITGAFLLASIGLYTNKDALKTTDITEPVQKTGQLIQKKTI